MLGLPRLLRLRLGFLLSVEGWTARQVVLRWGLTVFCLSLATVLLLTLLFTAHLLLLGLLVAMYLRGSFRGSLGSGEGRKVRVEIDR